MDLNITPSVLSGTISAPPSKSHAHRLIIAGALSKGASKIDNIVLSDDIVATINACASLGAKVEIGKNSITITGGKFKHKANINCIESGTTFRFFLPIVGATKTKTTFTGSGRLPQRPYETLANTLSSHGMKFSKTKGLPTEVKGKLTSGVFEIFGDVSSQFISGLLFAAPLLKNDSEIIILGDLQSKSYVDMTVDTLNKFGLSVSKTQKGYYVRSGHKYTAGNFSVESDFSNTAFWLAAGAFSEKGISITNLDFDSLQGDKIIIDIMKNMGANIVIDKNKCTVKKSKLNATEIDVSQIPDIAPILAVLLAYAEGESAITGCERLRIKESDRYKATCDILTTLGVKYKAVKDTIKIFGTAGEPFEGGRFDGYADHRIVMASAVASTNCKESCSITTSEAVKKSYPDFFTDFENLGGIYHELNLRQ